MNLSPFKNSEAAFSWKEVLLVLLLILYSGNPVLKHTFPEEPQLVCLAFLLGFLLLTRTKRVFTSSFTVITCIFATILLIQCIDFSFYPYFTIAGFITRLFIGYAVIRLVSDFPNIYVRIMVALAILSFGFYIPYLLISFAGVNLESIITHAAGVIDPENTGSRPVFFHTFLREFSPRNAGMFWEPGAFQGYLNLALIFLAFIKSEIPKKDYQFSFFILSAAVLTTLSTTGYIVYTLQLLLHYNWTATTRKVMINRIFKFSIIFTLVILGSYYAYNKLPFLKAKIQFQSQRVDMRQGQWYAQRLGSIVFDWDYIKRRPLTGWGIHVKTRYFLNPGMASSGGMGNGFSDFTAKFGVIGMLTWLAAVFIGFRRMSKMKILPGIFVCILLILELQGECFLGYSLFLGLAFLTPSAPNARKIAYSGT